MVFYFLFWLLAFLRCTASFTTCRNAPSRQRQSSSLLKAADCWPSIAEIEVQHLSGETVKLGQVLKKEEQTVILSCLSHFGDFNAWELTQQYIPATQGDDLITCPVVLVGIGSVESANQFADDLSLSNNDYLTLLVDEKGAVTEALGCYRGWLAVDQSHAERWPATDVNPYIKLLGMIFGFGSPGTISRVLYGYVGDKTGGPQSRKWVVDSLLHGSEKGRWPALTQEAFEGVPDDSGLRPFELATLRAQTGIHIVLNWSKLGPKNGDLFTRMGGTFVFQNERCIYEYFDTGILAYASMGEVSEATKST